MLVVEIVVVGIAIVLGVRGADGAVQLPAAIHLRAVVTVAGLFGGRRAVQRAVGVGRGRGRVLRLRAAMVVRVGGRCDGQRIRRRHPANVPRSGVRAKSECLDSCCNWTGGRAEQ